MKDLNCKPDSMSLKWIESPLLSVTDQTKPDQSVDFHLYEESEALSKIKMASIYITAQYIIFSKPLKYCHNGRQSQR